MRQVNLDDTWVRRQKIRLVMRVFVVFVAFLSLFVVTNNVFAGITKEKLKIFNANHILYWDDCSSGGGSGTGLLPGGTTIEQIWNYFVGAGISGVSDSAEVISGVIGNFASESGSVDNVDPFAVNSGGCTGISQECGKASQIKDAVINAGCAWGDSSENNKGCAIKAELDFITSTPDWTAFVNGIGSPDHKTGVDGAKSYAELFLGVYERAVGGGEPLTDGGVYNYVVNDYYGGDSSYADTGYQALSGRRTNAETIYNTYKDSATPPEGGGDSNILNETAIELSWPDRSHDKRDAKPEYTAALADPRVNLSTYGDPVSFGASCDAFVATVVRYSGYDPDIKCCGAKNMNGYLNEHPEKYEDVTASIHGESDMQPGDIRSHSDHIEMYVRLSNGEGRIASASWNERTADHGIGYYEDSSFQVFRPKNIPGASSNTGGNCTVGGGGGGRLVEGGMTLEEAERFMKDYAAAAEDFSVRTSIHFQGALVSVPSDGPCPDGTFNNCVAFSQWFLNKYTSIGPDWGNTVNGAEMVDRLHNTQGLPTGSEPRPYAIFSIPYKVYNHTGVVLGVSGDTVIVGEASCGASNGGRYYAPRAKAYSLSKEIYPEEWSFVYTDDIINLSGLN